MELIRISRLPSIILVDSQEDYIPIVDHTTETSKKCTPEQLVATTIKIAQLYLIEGTTVCAIADGVGYFRVPEVYEGKKLISAEAGTVTAGVTGQMSIQIYNATRAVNLLTTQMIIESGETDTVTSATQPVIDEANNTLFAGNLLRIDITGVHTTPARGLIVTIGMR